MSLENMLLNSKQQKTFSDLSGATIATDANKHMGYLMENVQYTAIKVPSKVKSIKLLACQNVVLRLTHLPICGLTLSRCTNIEIYCQNMGYIDISRCTGIIVHYERDAKSSDQLTISIDRCTDVVANEESIGQYTESTWVV